MASPLREIAVSEGRCAMGDGTLLAYSLLGDGGAQRRTVLIHSLAMDRHFWRPVARQLAAHGAVLVYDCRGHGESGKPAGPYTPDLFADDLVSLLDHVGWDRALVAGASMGGCVALAFAASHPARTAGLGLIDTTAWYGADAPSAWAERAERAVRDGLASLVAFQTTRWFGDRFRAERPDVVKECVDTFLRNTTAAYAESCRMLGAADLRVALAGIKTPTAILVGEQDYATPLAMAEALHRGIAGSTLAVIPGARHLTPLEVPERIAGALEHLRAAAFKAEAAE